MYIDTHAHFDLCLQNEGTTEELLIEGLAANKVKYAVQVSIDCGGLDWSYKFSMKNPCILFTTGIHPSSRADEKDLLFFSDFTGNVLENKDGNLLFGIGETGLDFYRMHQPRDMQINSFEFQIDTANKLGLPLIVHSRNAMEETLGILKNKLPEIGIMHCFSGDRKIAIKYLDLGFYISFAGNLTYKKALDLHDAAAYVPIDRLLLETDAPFLTPVPFRGKENKPDNVVYTYKFLADLRKDNILTLSDQIYKNFEGILRRRNFNYSKNRE